MIQVLRDLKIIERKASYLNQVLNIEVLNNENYIYT